MRFALLPLLIFGLCASALAADDDYAAELVSRAEKLKLSERPEWHTLMHYEANWILPGLASQLDDPRFFLAADGKTNPGSELAATIKSFFSEIEDTEEAQHPQCGFPARYRWLKEQLQFDPTRLPEEPCTRFQEWVAALAPSEVTMIYPSSYLNNPSSSFGHTLIRLDTAEQDEDTRLLAYSANFAAITQEEKGFVYAIKGLFGGYVGYFTIVPYYTKVEEYSDLQNRDVWEYSLTLTEDEIDMLLRHLWELGTYYFDYFFFDENCSFHLLSLLEAARPGLKLTGDYPLWAIPVDTVRTVMEAPNLAGRVTYRPSAATILRQRIKELSASEQRLVKQIAIGEVPTASPEVQALEPDKRAEILDASYAFLNYEHIAGARRSPEDKRRAYELLSLRSKLPEPTRIIDIKTPSPRPDQGHGSARVAVGGGYENGEWFYQLRARTAYHDLLDPHGGYPLGAQIELLDTTVRHTEDDEMDLENLSFVEIISLAPRTYFFKPTSWRVNIALTRKRFSDTSSTLALQFDGGAGLSYSLGKDGLAYALLEPYAIASDRLDEKFSLGGGPRLGFFYDITDRVRFAGFARAFHFPLGEDFSGGELNAALRYTISTNHALKASFNRIEEFDYYRSTTLLEWNIYF